MSVALCVHYCLGYWKCFQHGWRSGSAEHEFLRIKTKEVLQLPDYEYCLIHFGRVTEQEPQLEHAHLAQRRHLWIEQVNFVWESPLWVV